MTTVARLFAVGLAVGVAVVLLGACAPPAPQKPTESIESVESTRLLAPGEYADALRTASAGYTWPADRRPDIDKVISDSQPPDGALAQADLVTVVLSMVNACAWYLSWSEAVKQGRTEQASRELAMLPLLPVAKIDPSAAQLVKQIADSARAGDVEPAIGYAEANCDNVRWVEIPGA